MSAARRIRGNLLTRHKARGTYVPVRLVALNVADVIVQEARIPKDRKSLFFQSSGSVEARTSWGGPSAESHQFAPPIQAIEPRRVPRAAPIPLCSHPCGPIGFGPMRRLTTLAQSSNFTL